MEPDLHAKQSDSDAPHFAEKVPAAQSKQPVASSFEYFPGGHDEHKYLAPVENVPAGQAEQQDLKSPDFESQLSFDGSFEV